MAVLSCKKTDNVTGGDDGERKVYNEKWIVTVESGDQPATIIISNFKDIPKVGDPHPIDPQATLKRRSVEPTENRTVWILNTDYEYSVGEKADTSGGGGGGGMQVLEFSGGAWQEDYIMEQDQDGKPLINSATDKFEYMSTRSHPLFRITARSKDYLVNKYIYEVGSTNNSSWSILGLTFPKETLLFDDFSFKNLDFGWWEYSFTIKARMVSEPAPWSRNPLKGSKKRQEGENRTQGWRAFILDAGYRELDDKKALIPIIPKDENNQKTSTPVSSPWPLDGDGHALRREEFGDGVWLKFKEFPTTGFYKFRFNFDSLLTPDALKGIY